VSYRYPDVSDAMTAAGVDRMGAAYRDYYRLSEERVLKRFTNTLNSSQRLLDVGCGEGRLLSTYLDHVAHAVLQEPDASRLAVATTKAQSLAPKVAIEQRPLHAITDTFDVVLCSHVLQHVSAEPFVAQLASVVRPGGVLALSTAYALHGESIYLQSLVFEGKPVSWLVSKDRFNMLCTTPESGVLPTRLFDREALVSLLEQAQFEVFDFRAYHVGFGDFERLESGLDVDEKVNETPLWAQEREADVLVLARRRR
jgi:2-polyprenyl-3-methyl-5-hydroxy-6-metoxy-1,4-benzoquinol methylase